MIPLEGFWSEGLQIVACEWWKISGSVWLKPRYFTPSNPLVGRNDDLASIARGIMSMADDAVYLRQVLCI